MCLVTHAQFHEKMQKNNIRILRRGDVLNKAWITVPRVIFLHRQDLLRLDIKLQNVSFEAQEVRQLR